MRLLARVHLCVRLRPRRRHRPLGGRLERCALRDPGRRLARPRARHARRAARPAREARRRSRPLQPPLGPDRGRSRRVRLGGQRCRARTGCAASGIAAVVGLVGSPRWANGGRTPNFAPGATSFAGFAREAATRYRWVSQWLVWNEPNQARWLRPTTAAVYVRQILNPAYRGDSRGQPAREGRRRRHGASRLEPGACRRSPGSAGCAAAGARLDAYAHHPYPSSSRETPFTGGCGHCTTITMATLERLLTEVGRAFGPKRIWLTEYGYQTGALRRQPAAPGRADRPVRPQSAQGAARRHADPLSRRGRAGGGRFQSGLFHRSGRPKLAALAFPLPLAQAGRSGGNLVLWGQVRPRAGVQTFRVQVRTGGVWRFSGGVRRTSARGFFSVAVPAARGDGRADLFAAGRRLQRARSSPGRATEQRVRSYLSAPVARF